MTPKRILIETDPGIDDALTFLLALASPELLTFEEHYVDVDISGEGSMSSTFADFYHTTGKPANMKVALEVCGEEFVDLFVERIKYLSSST
jgi:inosine-uridine nucleoside N-ribohydrolase